MTVKWLVRAWVTPSAEGVPGPVPTHVPAQDAGREATVADGEGVAPDAPCGPVVQAGLVTVGGSGRGRPGQTSSDFGQQVPMGEAAAHHADHGRDVDGRESDSKTQDLRSSGRFH